MRLISAIIRRSMCFLGDILHDHYEVAPTHDYSESLLRRAIFLFLLNYSSVIKTCHLHNLRRMVRRSCAIDRNASNHENGRETSDKLYGRYSLNEVCEKTYEVSPRNTLERRSLNWRSFWRNLEILLC